MDLQRFKRKPLMGIIRGVERDAIAPLVDEAIAAGLETLEITMNTRAAPELIAEARRAAGPGLAIGAGTVLGAEDLKRALDAGATFVVMPTLIQEVVAACVESKVPVFPGALTPTEIHAAWSAGATMVKVFPAQFFGPEYFREIKGPFHEIRLLACGGVSAGNLRDYATCGADAFAFGGSVFRRSWIEAREYAKVGACIRALVEALPDARIGI